MDAPSELNRLRTIAYGRTSDAEEERAAADALRQLRELEKYPVAEPGSPDELAQRASRSVEALAANDAALRQAQGTTVAEPVEAPSNRRPLFWVAIAAILLLCFGAGFATASALRVTPSSDEPDYTQSPDPTAEPGQPQLSDAEKVEAGKRVSAAIAVLLAPQSEEDRAIMPKTVAALELNVATTQLLTEPGTYPRIFGAKNMADDICLVWEKSGGGWGSTCLPTADFGINGGISTGVNVNGVVYSWDGTTTTFDVE